MHCDDFELTLQECLDRRVSPQDEPMISDHAATCPACRGFLVQMLTVVEAIGHIDELGAGSDLPARVIGELRAVTRPVAATESRAWRMSAPFWAVLAASLLVAATIGFMNRRSETPTTVVEPLVTVQPSTPNADALNVDPRWLLPQLVQWDAAVTSSAKPATESLFDQDLRSSLAPVATSTTSALDALWQVLAASPEDARS